MKLDFSNFDGSGRKPREQQKFALDWLAANYDTCRAFAFTAPMGIGKSGISKAIQNIIPNTRYLTFSNNLVKQYADEYEDVTPYYGSANYKTLAQ